MARIILVVQLLGTILKFAVQFSHFENRFLSFKPQWKLLFEDVKVHFQLSHQPK